MDGVWMIGKRSDKVPKVKSLTATVPFGNDLGTRNLIQSTCGALGSDQGLVDTTGYGLNERGHRSGVDETGT